MKLNNFGLAFVPDRLLLSPHRYGFYLITPVLHRQRNCQCLAPLAAA